MTTERRIAYVGATLIDATGSAPIPDATVVVADGRFTHVGGPGDAADLGNAEIIDLAGSYIVPGLLDANVHLVIHIDPDILLRFEPGAYDALVLEAAQVALRAGITTVFDTWGPLESLRRVRDAIDAGNAIGSRIFCAGNIIGNDGPWSVDFFPQLVQGVSTEVIDAVNKHWDQGVGARLTWMSSDDVRLAVRRYIAESGVDFIKFASSSHAHSRFLALSPDSQRVIVEEAHAAGLTAQACTQSPEALLASIDAGVDLIQHADLTGIYPMPERTLQAIVDSRLPVVAFLYTERHTAAFRDRKPVWHANSEWGEVMVIKEQNDRRLIAAGANILLANDMGVYGPTARTSPMWGPFQDGLPDVPTHLGVGHIHWLRAAIEQGMTPLAALQATTREIAHAYGVAADYGTIEVGKRADMLILNGDPLADVDNYARIRNVIKGGTRVDRESLPIDPVLTAGAAGA